MSSAWTKEPWTAESPEKFMSEGIWGSDGNRVVGGCDREDGFCIMGEEDRARAVACVNAMAGIEDPVMFVAYANAQTEYFIRGQMPFLVKQAVEVRELVEAAQEAGEALACTEYEISDTLKTLRAALAKFNKKP